MSNINFKYIREVIDTLLKKSSGGAIFTNGYQDLDVSDYEEEPSEKTIELAEFSLNSHYANLFRSLNSNGNHDIVLDLDEFHKYEVDDEGNAILELSFDSSQVSEEDMKKIVENYLQIGEVV